MQLVVIQRIIGLLLMTFSVAMLTPVAIDMLYRDGDRTPFLLSFAFTLGVGFLCWAPVRKVHHELRVRDGFVVVTMFWTILGLFGALPFFLSNVPHMRFVDAVFESFSGLTTTGASVLPSVEHLPHAINFYRMQLQWLGGMGIIVLALAILPMLGVGGMQLYRAETPGPMKDTKLTPRIRETIKALWYIYLGLTVSCALAFWAAGMTLFDAVTHSFTVLSTGGFSTHDKSLGYFHSPLIDAIAMIFLMLGSINFALHFLAWRSLSLKVYWYDSEFKAYVLALVLISVVTVGYLYISNTFSTLPEAVYHGIFQVVSLASTSGLVTTGFSNWPGFLPVLLLFSSFICGCAGSTAGGIKMIRFLLLIKQGAREIMRLIHPNGQFLVKINRRPMPEKVVESVWGFFSVYVAAFMAILLVLMSTGLDQVTAFSAVVACINNMGTGLGAVSANFSSLNDVAKWALVLAMVMGRLEIFPLLVLITPAFWRR